MLELLVVLPVSERVDGCSEIVFGEPCPTCPFIENEISCCVSNFDLSSVLEIWSLSLVVVASIAITESEVASTMEVGVRGTVTSRTECLRHICFLFLNHHTSFNKFCSS